MDSDQQQQQQQHYSATGAGSNKNIGHYSQQLTYLLGELKHIYDQRDDPEKKRKAAFERLAEISKIMRIILEKYSLLESKELLLNASQLVKAVKTYDYDNYSFELHSKLIDNINALYKSFQFNISNCLLQDGISMSSTKSLDSNNITTANKSQSSPTTLTTQKLQYQQQQQQVQQQSIIGSSNRSRTLPNNMFEEKIYSYKFGLDELIKQAKFWCKYLKELVIYIEKRAQIENEYNRSVMKNNQNISSMIQQFKNEKAFLPFHNNYDQLCQCEMKNVNMCYNNFDMLCKDILQPVNEFRTEFEKEIKKIKEEWSKASKQLNDAINAYSKSRENFHAQKLQDIDNNNKIGMKLSYLENEFNEADATNTKYLCLINAQKELFNKSKRELINRLQNLMAIAEMKIKEITIHYFETLRDSIIYSPDEINSSLININQYEMGKPYRDFSNSLKITMDDSVIGGGGGGGGGGGDSSSYNYNPYASQNHLYTQPHYLTENIIDIDDSSDSDSGQNNSENFEVFMNKRQSQQQKYVRKESKAMTNKAPSAENIQMKGIEKKYKSVYHFKKGANCNDNEANHFFGKPLVQLSKNVALDFLKQCVHQIETRGSRISGIYRVSAVKSQVDSLTKAYETNPNSVDLSNISPNVIANLLKQFFRKLPEPLLTFQLYNEFIEVASRYSKNSQIDQSNEDDIVNRLKKICRLLPLVHYNTLRYLITHLKRISNDAEFNQMNPSNLGIVFGPTLLKKADNDDTNMLYDTNHQSRVIELFILYADRIFDINESENNDYFGGKNSAGLQRNNSFGQADNNKGFLDSSSSSSMKENGDSLNIFGNRLSKSATCSSINKKDLNQIKYDKNQAKYKFFHLDINNQSQQRFSSYSPQHIYSEANSPKTNVNKVFTTITNYSNNNNRLVKNDVELSPFSQITAASKSSGPLNRHVESLHKQQPQQQNHVKRIVSGYQMISRIGGNSGSSSQQSSFSPQSSPTPIYARNNELSKSSSDIYTYKNINFSINSNEEHV